MTTPLYYLLQILIFCISSIIGWSFVAIKEQATYPIDFTIGSIPGTLLALSLHAGNGLISIPGQKKYGVSKNIRISTFLVNLLASLIAIQLILNTAKPYPQGVTYGVFDASIQKQQESKL